MLVCAETCITLCYNNAIKGIIQVSVSPRLSDPSVKCQTSDLYVYHASRLYDRTLFSTASYSHSNQLLTIPRPSSPSIYVVKSTFGLPGLYKSARTLVSYPEDIRASVTRSQCFGKISVNRRKRP